MEPMKSASLKMVEAEREPEAEARPVRPAVDPASLRHRGLHGGPFWQAIPAYRGVSEEEFLDHKFQMKHTITRPDRLLATAQDLVSREFYADVEEGFHRAPM